jgi:ParB/RepB/Spo0J family partition protein
MTMTMMMKLSDIKPNPKQPRKEFDEEGLKDLAENIKQVGLKQALIVRPLSSDGKSYQLVDGERRYRACKLIPLEEVPVEIREDIKTEEDAAVQSFIINEERSAYSPQDRDAYIFNLYQTTKLSTRKLAQKLGNHHSFIDHCIAAHRFRQKVHELVPGRVGSLELTPKALKNTAIIKDDHVRIKVLELIHDGKISSSSSADEIQWAAKLLTLEKQGKAPKGLVEAWTCGLFTIGQINEELDKPGPPFWRLVSDDVPKELKEAVLFVWAKSNTARANYLRSEFYKKYSTDVNMHDAINLEDLMNNVPNPRIYKVGNLPPDMPAKEKKRIREAIEMQMKVYREDSAEFLKQYEEYEKLILSPEAIESKYGYKVRRQFSRWIVPAWDSGLERTEHIGDELDELYHSGMSKEEEDEWWKKVDEARDLRIAILDLLADYEGMKSLREALANDEARRQQQQQQQEEGYVREEEEEEEKAEDEKK